MSLILEALRKSEAERRRGATPDLHTELPTSPVLARSTVPGWVLWMLAAAAAIALLLWGAHAWWTPTPTRMATAVKPAPTPMPAKPALPPVSRLSPPPPVVAPLPRVTAAVPSAGKRAATSAPPTELLPPPAVQRASASTPITTAPAPDDALSLSDLTPDERKALPPLKLSMHLWNDDASRRFVILDGNRLREGDRDGDAVVTAITTDGVLLDWNGRRIRLSIR
ncbi:MAG TPA: general secretion pathway protein GspB [Luteimonas sp.]|jgi:general secretion pathway protein B|nr:general secretion pathway protein GspB [Luteimonas sp.]